MPGRGRSAPMSWGWAPGMTPTGVQRSYTGATPGSGHRSNLPNIIRAHMEGVRIDVLRRNREAAAICYARARALTWTLGKIATRRYYDQWTYEIRPTGAIVYNNAAHATVIETGRAPGMLPPVDRIEEWFDAKAKRGLGGLHYLAGARGGDWRRRQVIWLIARSIRDKGTPAEPIMERAMQEARFTYVRKLVHTLLYYNARTQAQQGTFMDRLKFTDSSGNVQPAFVGGEPHKEFVEGWREFQFHAERVQPLIEAGYPAIGSGEMPGRDY